ncbi:MAG: Bifunctional NAD(P)H-hydrate repair enzyme Nnr [Phycisphaerae bacterium]|nr:Bifunctional NAD(P)H-hydrate repair enzyme Nnr [Phycisphaerae bacterium]
MALKPVITQEVAALPARADDAHKGDVGRVLIIGGCDGLVSMSGAPALAARAAFRCGAGLVRVVAPEGVKPVVMTLVPMATTQTLPTGSGDCAKELRTICDRFEADVVALGPGLGDSLSSSAVLEFVQSCRVPVVLDADGLNRLAEHGRTQLQDAGRIVLTPHPGEARRLLGTGAIGSDSLARQKAALDLHEAFGAVIVLKGRHTVVTDGERMYVNQTGNSGLATAGTGDVLTGMIAALIGQGMPVLEASILAVHVHGLAGDFAAQDLGVVSMTAEDVIAYLADAFAELEE